MKVMHCPQHIGQNLEHNLVGFAQVAPHSGGFTEMDFGNHANIPVIKRKLKSYSVFAQDHGGHSQETPVAVRRGPSTQIIGAHTVPMTPEVNPGTGNDRWYTVVKFYYYGRKVAHLATHTDAAIQAANGVVSYTNPRAKANVRAHEIIAQGGEALIKDGYSLFITGDFNYKRVPGVPLWEYAPQRMIFERLGMQWFEQGLDYMAWTPDWTLRSPVTVLPRATGINGSDHPWLVGRFKHVRKP